MLNGMLACSVIRIRRLVYNSPVTTSFSQKGEVREIKVSPIHNDRKLNKYLVAGKSIK